MVFKYFYIILNKTSLNYIKLFLQIQYDTIYYTTKIFDIFLRFLYYIFMRL